VLPKQGAQHPECFFPDRVKVEPNPTWRARKLGIHYSVYKLNASATLARKRHIYDALTLIQNSAKKGAKIVKSVLEAARVNGIKKGFNEERMFVKEVVLGKALGPKKLDIKARGKMGIIYAPRCSITVIMEEKAPADFYKMIVKGETPPAVGHTFRKMLY
jgi:ribosomal protein L22